MLDKRNQKLYKSLRGEYRKYARRLKVTLLDCCKGKDEINETLGDVFSMLAEAQGAGRDFADVIPDPAASIRETALCFPARTMRRNTAFVLLLAGLAVLLCACGITIHLTSPIELDAVHDIDYDTEQRIASWEPVPHATEYQVSVNSTFLGSTEGTAYALDEDDYANMDELNITVTARAGGRYLGGSGTTVYQRTMPSVRRVLTLSELFTNGFSSEFTYPAGVYESIVLQLRPEINLCVKFYGPSLRALRRGSIYSDERDWGEPMDTDSYLILNAGVSYVIEIEPDDYDPTVGFEIRLMNLLSYAKSYYPYLSKGITLFTRERIGIDPYHGLPDVSSDPDWNTAFTAEGFRFACIRSLADLDQAEWMDSFVMDHTDSGYDRIAFWLVDNTQGESAHFSAKNRIETVSVSDRVTVSAAPGWTTYNFLVTNLSLPIDYLLLYRHGTDSLFFSHARTDGSWPLEFSSTSTHQSLEAYVMLLDNGTYPTTVTLSAYNPNNEAVEFICETLHTVRVTEELLEQGSTITLQPGITRIENITHFLIRIRSNDQFFASDHLFPFPKTYYYMREFSFTTSTNVLNPYDEPIELTLTPYTPL